MPGRVRLETAHDFYFFAELRCRCETVACTDAVHSLSPFPPLSPTCWVPSRYLALRIFRGLVANLPGSSQICLARRKSACKQSRLQAKPASKAACKPRWAASAGLTDRSVVTRDAVHKAHFCRSALHICSAPREIAPREICSVCMQACGCRLEPAVRRSTTQSKTSSAICGTFIWIYHSHQT